MFNRRRGLFALLLCAFLLTQSAASASGRTIALEQTGRLHRKSVRNGVNFFEGSATGTLPGAVSAALEIDLFSVSGIVTFFPRGGSITLNVAGKPRGLKNVRGTMTVIAGTGRFSKARGTADFRGTLNRRTWRATVSASGSLTY